MRKRKIAEKIERMMVEEELELHGLDSKRARRNPISIVWFDEDYDEPRKVEQYREVMFDASNSKLFETVEAE